MGGRSLVTLAREQTFSRSPRTDLEDAFRKAIRIGLGVQEPYFSVVRSKMAFGDYQCNAALSLASVVRLPPEIVAGKLIDHLQAPHIVSNVSVTGTPQSICCEFFSSLCTFLLLLLLLPSIRVGLH